MTTVPPATPATPATPAAKSPILSILSLVGGGLSVITCGWGAIFGIAGIVLGVMGRKKEPNGKGLAIAGIITGIVGILLGVGQLIFWLVLGLGSASYGNFGY